MDQESDGVRLVVIWRLPGRGGETCTAFRFEGATLIVGAELGDSGT